MQAGTAQEGEEGMNYEIQSINKSGRTDCLALSQNREQSRVTGSGRRCKGNRGLTPVHFRKMYT